MGGLTEGLGLGRGAVRVVEEGFMEEGGNVFTGGFGVGGEREGE